MLQARCEEYHRSGEAAPMSLMTYDEARPWAEAMREAVLTKRMPPWFGDSAHGVFANDRTLNSSQIQVLTDWAETGPVEGDPSDAPPALTFAQGWTIGEPDLVLDMGFDYETPAEGEVPYTYVAVPTGFSVDRWVESIEVRPGAPVRSSTTSSFRLARRTARSSDPFPSASRMYRKGATGGPSPILDEASWKVRRPTRK